MRSHFELVEPSYYPFTHTRMLSLAQAGNVYLFMHELMKKTNEDLDFVSKLHVAIQVVNTIAILAR